jgi:hypothetical protein
MLQLRVELVILFIYKWQQKKKTFFPIWKKIAIWQNFDTKKNLKSLLPWKV